MKNKDAVGQKTRIAMHLKPQASYALPVHPDAPVRKSGKLWEGRDVYKGEELRIQPARRGAMDAFSLPSVGLRT